MSNLFTLQRVGGNKIGTGSRIVWTEDQIKYIINDYNKNHNIKKLSQKFNTSQETVRKLLHRNGIETLLTCHKEKNKHPRDSRFFEKIDSPEKAYWLGFLYADGYVENVGRYVVRINLQRDDADHLYKFLKAIKATNIEVKYTTKKAADKEYYGCYVSLSDKDMVNDLISKGCVPRKSLILSFPNEDIVPYNLLSHFIRGYSDGDGSLYTSLSKKSGKIIYGWHILGTKKFLIGIQNYLGLNRLKLEDRGNYFSLNVSGAKLLIETLSCIYNDSFSDIELTRKRKKFDDLLLQRMNGEPINVGCT